MKSLTDFARFSVVLETGAVASEVLAVAFGHAYSLVLAWK